MYNSPLGCVTLVGAGPGDPELLTLAGRDALASAEIVFYDALVDQKILDFTPAACERVCVGKRGGHTSTPQTEIHQMLSQAARKFQRIIRLKGGDPFLFGRGYEEVEWLREQGVPVRVIPGVSAALGVPTTALLPLTHRQLARSIGIFAGHTSDDTPPDYASLVGLDSLVCLMGLGKIKEICTGLIAAGKPADTPVAVIWGGSLPSQKLLLGTLRDIDERAKQEKTTTDPALIVIGKTVKMCIGK